MGPMKVALATIEDYFKTSSSLNGLNHAARSTNCLQRSFWLALFVLGLTFTVPAIVDIVRDYDKYPVSTTSVLSHRNRAQFPAVTICGTNRIHCLNLYKTRLALANKAKKDSRHLEVLTALLNLTRCNDQLCTLMITLLPDVRVSNEQDGDVDFAYTINCWKDHPILDERQTAKQNLCYNFHQMTNDAQITAEKRLKANSSWDTMSCTMSDVCDHLRSLTPAAIQTAEKSGVGLEARDQCQSEEESDSQAPSNEQVTSPPTSSGSQEATITKLFMSLTADERRAVGHQMVSADNPNLITQPTKGMLKSCTFMGESCNDLKYWYQFNDPMNGNCFVFNAAFNRPDGLLEVSRAGLTTGLFLELFLDQSMYVPGATSAEAGARLVVHSPREFPVLAEKAVSLGPNTAVSIAVQEVSVARMEAPYVSNCTKSWDEVPLNKSLVTNDTDEMPNYDIGTCKSNCVQNEIISECGCFNIWFDLTLINVDAMANRPPPCSLAEIPDNEDRQCFDRILRAHNDGERRCGARRAACDEIDFQLTYSSSTWPSDSYWKTLAAEIGVPSEYLAVAAVAQHQRQNLQRDYLKASVFYKTLAVKSTVESPKYTGNGLISALGGALSLDLGIALISLFEVVELVAIIAVNVWKGKN